MSKEKMDEQEDVGSVKMAKESKEKAQLGKPSKYHGLQKTLLYIFAILAAGLIELIIIILFARFNS